LTGGATREVIRDVAVMTTASCGGGGGGDYSLLAPPPANCRHRGAAVRAGPVTALLYDDYDAAGVGPSLPLHHRGAPYNLTCYIPADLRQHQHQSSSYQYSRTPAVVDRAAHQSSSTYHDTRQLADITAAAAPSSDRGHYAAAASQRCDPAGYTGADGPPYGYATPPVPATPGRCPPPAAIPMTAAGAAEVSDAYSPYCATPGLLRTMSGGPGTGGCCVSGYCSPAGPCRCTETPLYDRHDPAVTVNGTGHLAAGEHVSCRLQHHHQQQHPQLHPHHHQSAGTYKWMTIKRSTPKTTSSSTLFT